MASPEIAKVPRRYGHNHGYDRGTGTGTDRHTGRKREAQTRESFRRTLLNSILIPGSGMEMLNCPWALNVTILLVTWLGRLLVILMLSNIVTTCWWSGALKMRHIFRQWPQEEVCRSIMSWIPHTQEREREASFPVATESLTVVHPALIWQFDCPLMTNNY